MTAFTVIRDIDLAVEEGGIATIVGANGAGKTTTLRALSRRAAAGAAARSSSPASRFRIFRRMTSWREASSWCRRAGGCFRR